MKNLFKTLIVALSVTFLSLNGIVNAATTTVNLGTAESFAILAGTPNITNTGGTTIIGDVGLSPATGAGITGLLASQVTGTIYTVDAFGPAGSVENAGLLTTAKNDLTAAFNVAAGRTPVTTIPTELGGTTLTDGVYDSNSATFGITAGAGPLVLDGLGDPASVFIFKMGAEGTGLTVGPGSVVSLINGASACNVFWELDTATIDTTATFKGNILALNSITVANGSNIEGRLLARNGNVTLINDTISVPVCAEVIPTPTPTPTPAPTPTPTTTPTSGSLSSSTSTLAVVPQFPNTGANAESKNTPRDNAILFLFVVSSVLYALKSSQRIKEDSE